ncbi:flagellin [Crenobacter sp. SG2303]|uniref:Flagellin n=1 Tax=Crenobacter oryzisoli TaxID=3056844 RepID=A0ABT7XQ02_9NEIS|nr:flagellin [Crenobacter sp. SG2303]MDN0075835.1 flagellin [Crenobacter sp. SG2303]
MALYVNTNISSLNAQRNLNTSESALATSLQRLSSGMRVNSAKDDAAGLAIASGMSAQIRGSNQAMRNANDAISMAQTAEGVLGQIESNVQRMRELAVQGANGTSTTANRVQMKLELDQLSNENKRLIKGSTFNGQTLMSTATAKVFTFHVGAGTTANDSIKMTIAAANFSLAATTSVTFTTQANASAAIGKFDTDLKTLGDMRAQLGAAQNRFSAVVTNLQTFTENTSAAKSRIMDTDFATESATLTRNQIIQQAGTAMLSQANQLPQAALSLLK